MVTTSTVYQIVNNVNGKIYIGQSSNTEERWYRHSVDYKRIKEKYLYRAMRKYGFENFEFSILEENISLDNINAREQYWINSKNSMVPNGYNMTNGGEGTFRTITEETREKLRQSAKNQVITDETRKKMSDNQTRRFSNPEERKIMSEKLKSNIEAMTKLSQRNSERLANMSASEKEEFEKKRIKGLIDKKGKKLKGICLETQQEYSFKSIREASKWIRENTEFKKACHTNISKVTRGKIDYVYGYEWILINSEGATTSSEERTASSGKTTGSA